MMAATLLLTVLEALASPCPSLPEPQAPPAPNTFPPRDDGGALRVLAVGHTEAPIAHARVEVRLAGGAPLVGHTDEGGRWLIEHAPPGLYTVALEHGQRAEHVQVASGNTTVVRLLGPREASPAQALPPSPHAWVAFDRSGCLGPCAPVNHVVTHGALSPRREARLRALLDCAAALPSFAALVRSDHVHTSLQVWEPGGASWSWQWYSGDPRAPHDELRRFTRKLERATR